MEKKSDPKLNIYCNENGEMDVSRVVISTVFKTLRYLVICGVLIFVVFLGAFPLKGMQFFETLGLKNRALEMVNIYVDREYKKDTTAFSNYADGLYYKMMLAEELYLDNVGKGGEKYLKQILDATSDYMAIEGISKRNLLIDKNNQNKMMPIVHGSVFSFEDRVCSLGYFASLRLRDADNFLIKNQSLSLNEVLDELQQLDENSLIFDIEQNGGICTVSQRLFIFLGQLNDYISYNLNSDSEDALALLTNDNDKLLKTLEQKLWIFKNYALSHCDNITGLNKADELSVRQAELYLLRCVGNIYNSLYDASKELGKDYSVWESAMYIDLDAESLTISDYYIKNRLPSYIEFYNDYISI